MLKRRSGMKINVEIDCTPEEARRVMGLPDLAPLHEQYIAALSEMMDPKTHPELIETFVKNWSPMNDGAMTFWRRFFDGSKSD
jgi:hypothetical protein